MSRIPSVSKTVTFAAPWWEPGETVELRTYVGSYDRGRIKSAAAVFSTAGTVEVRGHEAALTKLEVGIASWTWKDDDGNQLPLTRETLKLLEDRDADAILDRLNELWTQWREAPPVASATTEDAEQEAAFPETTSARPVRIARKASAR